MIRLKNEDEINGIRKSCHLLADMFNEILPKVKAGMSTKDVDDLCRNFITRSGGKPAWFREGFPSAACVSINEEVIHGLPSKKRIIHDGDLVSIDVGIDLNGYISDSTHSVLVGNVRPEWRKLDEVTLECLYAGIDVHEEPNVPNSPSSGANPRIQPGMVLAIEPMINLGTPSVHVHKNNWTVLTDDGLCSAHEEHTVAVFEDHTEILTDLNYKKYL